MKLVLRNVTGETITLEVCPGDTFLDLKTRIYEQAGIQLDLDLLNFKGRKISDDQVITKYFFETPEVQIETRSSTGRTQQGATPKLSLEAFCLENPALAAIEECCVPNCPNAVTLCPGKTFFSFPDDETRCQRWVLAVNRLDLLAKSIATISRYQAVCQDHFRGDHFVTDLRLELVADAEPCLFESKDIEPVAAISKKKPVLLSSDASVLNAMKNELDEVKDALDSENCFEISEGSEEGDEVTVLTTPINGTLCRLCATTIGEGATTFIYGSVGQERSLALKINMSLPVSVRSADPLPKQLCSGCMEKVEIVHDFSQQCLSAQLELEKFSRACTFRAQTLPLPAQPIEAQPIEAQPIEAQPIEAQPSDVQVLGSVPFDNNPLGDQYLSDQSLDCQLLDSQSLGCQSFEGQFLDGLTLNDQSLGEQSLGEPSLACPTFSEQFLGDPTLGEQFLGSESLVESLGCQFLGDPSLDDQSLGCQSLEEQPLGCQSLGEQPLGCQSLGEQPLGCQSLGEQPLGCQSLGENPEHPAHPCPLCRHGDMLVTGESVVQEFQQMDGLVQLELSDEEDDVDAVGISCRLCSELLPSKETCVTHAVTHSQEGGGLPCVICPDVLPDEIALRSHMHQHRVDMAGWTEAPVACGLCPQVFKLPETLSNHVARAHNPPHGGQLAPAAVSADCDICGGRFPSPAILKEHRGTHVVAKPFTCRACDRSFARKSLFSQHLMVHVTEDLSRQQRACKTCSEVVAGGYVKLLEHKKLQHGETVQRIEPAKPFRCEECGKTFAYRVTLITHLRKHTGELPFECRFCEKRFSQKRSLVLHERTHTGEKPFECEVCGKRFAQSAHMYSHVRLHTGEKPYRCGHCAATFRLKDVRDAHVRKHTGERPYRCEVCTKTFRTSHSYYQHMWIHQGKKPYPCSYCGKAFRRSNGLKIHVRIHTGEKPHACEVCGRGFAQKQDMKKHLNLHLTGRL